MTIAELNDAFRRTFAGGQVFLTRGVSALPCGAQAAITARVQSFEDFSEDNDPCGDHDFGIVKYEALQIYWKIDCYDLDHQFHSPDASDPAQTERILTIMLAEEY